MSKSKIKKVIPLKGGLDASRTDRPDIAANRADSSTFIAKVDKPQLNDKAGYVKRAYDNGADLKDIVRNSGLKVESVFALIGLDPTLERHKFDSLVEYRNNLIMKQS